MSTWDIVSPVGLSECVISVLTRLFPAGVKARQRGFLLLDLIRKNCDLERWNAFSYGRDQVVRFN